MIETGLNGRVAVITGANQGIGAATARAQVSQGVAVFLTYYRMAADEFTTGAAFPEAYAIERARSADHLVEEIRAAGGSAASLEADLADPEVPRRIFETAEAALGPVEILVNNASGWLADTFLPTAEDRFGRRLRTVDADSFRRQFAVDACAPALLIAEFARRHLGHGGSWGRIIGLTSGGVGGFPEEVSYGAAKAAQENHTMSAAAELGAHGVTANIVYPPVTDTGWITPDVAEAIAADGTAGRIAMPEDVAKVIVWLVSEQARFITGQIIRMAAPLWPTRHVGHAPRSELSSPRCGRGGPRACPNSPGVRGICRQERTRVH